MISHEDQLLDTIMACYDQYLYEFPGLSTPETAELKRFATRTLLERMEFIKQCQIPGKSEFKTDGFLIEVTPVEDRYIISWKKICPVW